MATNFAVANQYNVFVLGNMNMSSTDAEGRVAIGGDAKLTNYGVGSSILPLPPYATDPSLVIGGAVDINYASNASGNTVISPVTVVTNYTMSNPNGSLISGTPIDFEKERQYLRCASGYWGGLTPNTKGEVSYAFLKITGTDPVLNIFEFDALNIYGSGLALSQLYGIDIIAPSGSTILINIKGTNIAYGSYGIFRNGITATRNDARTILWNFPEAQTWTNATTGIMGSVLAPFATANTTYSQINGNIIFENYNGNAESHNELFEGELPEPILCKGPVPVPENTRCQAITDLIESVALEQTALSHILNAEGEKLQKVISMEEATTDEILEINNSVASMVKSITRLEMILQSKIENFEGCICDCQQI